MKRGDVCYGMLRAAACVDESDHHAPECAFGMGKLCERRESVKRAKTVMGELGELRCCSR